MRIAEVEMYSDATNAAVLRHPDRKFPGVLVQGDGLHNLCALADGVCRRLEPTSEEFAEANELRNMLWGYLTHYKSVLVKGGIKMPFSEGGPAHKA